MNRLAREKSPYLQQHASNPVDWYPWCDEAFAKAVAEDKPILLSIGYSTCHWCHVMNRESFMDEETASIINKYFVAIKVDREERPDVDQLYMKAVVSLTGQGGWPLTVFLTPELKPFYGGTYFPPEDKFGLPSFKRILLTIAHFWMNDRARIVEASSNLLEYLRQSSKSSFSVPTQEVSHEAFLNLSRMFDQLYGGFGEAPKFPNAPYLSFLIMYYVKSKSSLALKMLNKSLTHMAKGGVFDQLGGGFHRYSTDRYWLIPHFEKMLYDNALLASIYIDAWRITGEPLYRRVAEKTLQWMLNEMAAPEGGFYSAQDAESGGVEGEFYTWSKDELDRLVGSEAFNLAYGVSEEGNFEGRNILYVSKDVKQVASELGIDETKVEEELLKAHKTLLEERGRRTKPSIDKKILTSWNALAASAFSTAYQAFGDDTYLQVAGKTLLFIKQHLTEGDILYHSWCEGEARVKGLLEDYAYLIKALIDLYESDFSIEWIEWAYRLAEKAIELFEDKGEGGFYNTVEGNTILRLKDAQDGATPSPAATLTLNLLRLAALNQNSRFYSVSEKAIKAMWGAVAELPEQHTTLITAAEYKNSQLEVVIVGDPKQAKHLIEEVHRRPLPNKVLAQTLDGSEHSTVIPIVKGKVPLNGLPTAYVCVKQSCYPPTTSRDELRRLLS
ncbi:MAG: thioredoxin domain-containing protein [Nitrososphaerales archaeon]